MRTPAGSFGWPLAEHMRASLVTDALTMAVVHRGHPVTGVIFHADGGFDPDTSGLRQVARNPGVLLSVGRHRGVPGTTPWLSRSSQR